MLEIKFKGNEKLKSYGKCELLRKHLCAEVMVTCEPKQENRDYMNEIFAGLMWLG